MAFDIPMPASIQHHDSAVSQALYDDSMSRPPIIKVGSLEPTGPGSPTTTTPTDTTINNTKNVTNNKTIDNTKNITNDTTNIHNTTVNKTNIHDTTVNKTNVRDTTVNKTNEKTVTNNHETINNTGSTGSNVLKQVIGGTTVLPSTPGDGCTKTIGAVIGFAGLINLGGVESHPDEKCNTARNEVVKQQTLCAFTVDAANTAIEGLNSAGRQVDIARTTGSLPHLDIANQQRSIADRLGSGAAVAARNCVGDVPPAASPPPAWTAADLNASIPQSELSTTKRRR